MEKCADYEVPNSYWILLHNKKYKTIIQPRSQDFFPFLKFENFPPLQILKKG